MSPKPWDKRASNTLRLLVADRSMSKEDTNSTIRRYALHPVNELRADTSALAFANREPM